jgi:hypothetical protein
LDPRADLFFWDEFSLLAPDGSVSKVWLRARQLQNPRLPCPMRSIH